MWWRRGQGRPGRGTARQKCVEIEEDDAVMANIKKNSPYEKGRKCSTLFGDAGTQVSEKDAAAAAADLAKQKAQ